MKTHDRGLLPIRWSVLRVVLGAFLVLAAVALPPAAGPSHAQGILQSLTGDKSKETAGGDLETFLEKARGEGSTVIVIGPGGDQAAKAEPDMMMPTSSEQLLELRWRFRQITRNAPGFLSSIRETIDISSPDGTHNWLIRAVVTAIAGIALGVAVARLLQEWLRQHFSGLYDPKPDTRADKLAYLLMRGFLILLHTGVFFGVAILIAIIFDTEHEPSRQTIYMIVSAFAIYRVARYVLLMNLLAPDASAHRMIYLSDAEAKHIYRDWVAVILLLVPLWSLVDWINDLGVDLNVHKLMLMGTMAIVAITLGVLTIKHRNLSTKILLGPGDPDEKPQALVFFAKAVPLIVLVYLVVALVISVFRVALDLPSANLLMAAPLIVGLVALTAYAIAVLIIERLYERRARKFRMLKAVEAEKEAWRQMLEQMSSGDGDDIFAKPQQPPAEEAVYRPLFKKLWEHAAIIAILVVSAGELARLWGVDVGREGHPLTAILDIVLVVYLAYLAYRAVHIYINQKILDEGGSLDDTPTEPGEGEGGGMGQSRIVTLLPIFRNIMVVTIFVISGMIVLAQAGLDIAPLFAGAGVVGIAVGFGAQTLIRDIFSGAFYLIDDAFRKGEYIELENIRGTVEKISMRSFQLRHHLGALHTIPFGEIHQLTNYSRDWVMMKLPIRVTYDTDVEKVRKLVKQLGQELLEHPQVGNLFLQPLKSQGVIQMEDSAMIIRVKFMTKPGEQWVVRKIVYGAIRELFQREGIKFAHKEVTVRLADGKKVDDLTQAEREGVAGAAGRAIVDQEQEELQEAVGGDTR